MNEAPLNYLQHYILQRQKEQPGTMMFNLTKLFRLKKGIDQVKLAHALEDSARSHQALLTSLHQYPSGEIVQRQDLDAEDIQVEMVNVREANLLARRSSYVKSFDTFDEGLLDAIIFNCGSSAYLLSNFHHLICDGYSFPIILGDAKKVWDGQKLESDNYYEMLIRREARSQQPIASAARRLIAEVEKSHEFVGLPPNDFHHFPSYGCEEFDLEIPASFDARLEKMKTTRTHFFMAASALALARMVGCDNVNIDWVFHGRLTKEELRTVGAFMVDLPFPLQEISKKTPEEVIFEAKHWMFFGIKNAYAVRDNEDDPNEGRRLTFVYQDQWSELMSPGPVRGDGPFSWMIEETIPIRPPTITPENPFNVEIVEHEDSTRLMVEYDAGRYSYETIQSYRKAFHDASQWLLGEKV